MPNYNYGKIYKVIDLTNDNYYIGSTAVKYLSKRLEKHKSDFKVNKNIGTNSIIKNGNFKIELIENYPCKDIYELRKREGEYLKRCYSDILCKNIRLEYGLKRKANPNWHKEFMCNDLARQKQREYNNKHNNTEKRKDYNKNKNKENIICECGLTSVRGHLARHKETKRHLNKLIDKIFDMNY